MKYFEGEAKTRVTEERNEQKKKDDFHLAFVCV